jgi:hypothetical protein
MAVSRIPFSEVPNAVAALVQFLIDALSSGRINAALSDGSPVEVVANLVFKFTWHFRLIPVDTVNGV